MQPVPLAHLRTYVITCLCCVAADHLLYNAGLGGADFLAYSVLEEIFPNSTVDLVIAEFPPYHLKKSDAFSDRCVVRCHLEILLHSKSSEKYEFSVVCHMSLMSQFFVVAKEFPVACHMSLMSQFSQVCLIRREEKVSAAQALSG